MVIFTLSVMGYNQETDSYEHGLDGDAEFSTSGCELCADGLGNEVYRAEAIIDMDTYETIELEVCHECIARYHSGE